MPLRNQELVALCRTCKAPATASCERCGTPLCDEHAPADEDERCERCEGEFAARNDRLLRVADGTLETSVHRPIIVAVAIGWFALFPYIVSISDASAIALVACGLLSVATLIAWYLVTPPSRANARRILGKRRRAFLAKRAKSLPEST